MNFHRFSLSQPSQLDDKLLLPESPLNSLFPSPSPPMMAMSPNELVPVSHREKPENPPPMQPVHSPPKHVSKSFFIVSLGLKQNQLKRGIKKEFQK